MLFSFSVIFSFLAIFQVLQCAFLIFHVFQWFRHFSSPLVCVSYFPWFSVLLPCSMSYSWPFSFSSFFSIPCHISRPNGCISHFPHFRVSCHLPGPTLCIYHFSCFSIFLVIFHYLKSVILNFFDFQFFAIFRVLQCAFFIFLSFSVLRSFFKSLSVCFSVSMIFSFLAIFHVLEWRFLFFKLFQFSLTYFTF